MTELVNSLYKKMKKIGQDTFALAVCPAFFVFFGLYIFAWLAVTGSGSNLFFAFATALVLTLCLTIFTSRIHYKNERSVCILILIILFFTLTHEFYVVKNRFAFKDKSYVLRDEYATVKSVQKWGKGQAIVFARQSNQGKNEKFVLYRWGNFENTDKLYPVGATYSVSGFCHPFVAKTKKRKSAKPFDQWRFWQGRGVSSCLAPSKEPQMVSSPSGLSAIRQTLKQEINTRLLPKSKNYMEIFLLGQRGKGLEKLYKKSGVLHLMAISGLHVGLILALLCFLFKNKFLRFFGGTFLLWCYVILAGCPVSALRSAIMAQVLLFSLSFDLPRSSLNSVCLAGCLILLANPFCVTDVGFMLSFVCVLFLASLPENFLHNAFSLCVTSALIWIITAPILSHYFGSVSLTGILGNIFILPVFSAVFPLSMLLCFATLAFPFLPFCPTLLEAMLTSFETYVSVFAKLPAINIYQTDFLTVVASMIFFGILFYKLTENKAKSAILAIIFSTIIVILC